MWAVWRQLMKRWSVEPKSARDTRLCCPGTKHWLNWAPGNSGSLREQSRGYLGPLPPMHTLARLGSWLQDLREAVGTFISAGSGGPGVPLLLTFRRKVCQHRPRLLGSVENNARSCGIWLPAANSKFQNPGLKSSGALFFSGSTQHNLHTSLWSRKQSKAENRSQVQLSKP